MRLPDGPRQIVAGVLGGVAFMALFLGILLVWWLALLLGVAVYFASLLIIQRQKPLEEVQLTSRVSAADIASAVYILDEGADRISDAADRAPSRDQQTLNQMSDNLHKIAANIQKDPDDFRAARSFINVYLPNILQTVERYVSVAERATGDTAARLEDMSATIKSFDGAIARIHDATLENDLRALELEMSVLADKLDR